MFRRLSSVLKFDMDYIHKMALNQYGIYESVETKENHYSRKNQKKYVLDNIFDKID